MAAQSAELTIGRTFGVTFEHGDDFFTELSSVCQQHGVRYGYIPTFIGAFEYARVVGTCERANANAPMFDRSVELEYVETVGSGTLAYDHDNNTLLPHVHLSLGKRLHSADGVTSHLFEGRVQLLLEMVIVEVIAPTWTRPVNPDLFDLKLLTFG